MFLLIRKNLKWWVVGLLIGTVLFGLACLLVIIFFKPSSMETPLEGDNSPDAMPVSIPSAVPPIVPTATYPFLPAPTITVIPTVTARPLPPEGEAFSIGTSVEGKPLEVYRFGSGPIVRVIIGAIHGSYEGNTATLVFLIRDDLKNGLHKVPEDVTLYLMPIFNPDGFYDYISTNPVAGRPNAHGVDLNRNWDAFWQADWDRAGCFNYIPITAGSGPFSEPETQALRDFLLDNRVDALISYHSAMSAIFAGGRPEPDPASDSLARALSAVSFYLYPPVNDPGCQYTGQLIDWASDNGIAAVDVELTDHQSNDILINRKVLEAFLAWRR